MVGSATNDTSRCSTSNNDTAGRPARPRSSLSHQHAIIQEYANDAASQCNWNCRTLPLLLLLLVVVVVEAAAAYTVFVVVQVVAAAVFVFVFCFLLLIFIVVIIFYVNNESINAYKTVVMII